MRIGHLTPSSNTVLEPMVQAMTASRPEISHHFSRLAVRRIELDADAGGQFDRGRFLEAAALLADARCDVMVWTGTSAGWLGFESDRALCAAIGQRFGVPATTATLASLEACAALGARRLGLVTPYCAAVHRRIADNFAAAGIAIAAERHLDITDNFAFAEVPEATVAEMVRAVASADVAAVLILCTNLAGGRIAAELEPELGRPVLDSVALALWGALRALDAPGIAGWGRLLAHRPGIAA